MGCGRTDLLSLSNDFDNLRPDRVEVDAETLEGLGCDAFALVNEPQQNVLGADVRVIQQPSLFLGQHDDPPSSIGKPFKH